MAICHSWVTQVYLVCGGMAIQRQTGRLIHLRQRKTAAVRLSQHHARCHRASLCLRFSLCLTAHDYFHLKITHSKVLEESSSFPMPRRSADFLCQFKVILGKELALVQTTRTLMGSLTLPALLTAASGAKCQYPHRSQTLQGRQLSSGK